MVNTKNKDILKIYLYLDKNKVKILTIEYDFDDFNTNDDVFCNLIQNKVKGYDKVEVFANSRGGKLWIINDFYIDIIMTCRSLGIPVEAIEYNVADPDKSDEDIFNDHKSNKRS